MAKNITELMLAVPVASDVLHGVSVSGEVDRKFTVASVAALAAPVVTLIPYPPQVWTEAGFQTGVSIPANDNWNTLYGNGTYILTNFGSGLYLVEVGFTVTLSGARRIVLIELPTGLSLTKNVFGTVALDNNGTVVFAQLYGDEGLGAESPRLGIYGIAGNYAAGSLNLYFSTWMHIQAAA